MTYLLPVFSDPALPHGVVRFVRSGPDGQLTRTVQRWGSGPWNMPGRRVEWLELNPASAAQTVGDAWRGLAVLPAAH